MIAGLLAFYAVLLGLAYAACLAASLGFYRRRLDGPVEPFTVVKPIKGLDVELEANLRALVEADADGSLQVLFALETEEDSAYPVARRVADAYPDRDVTVVLTGPSGGRMGKIHNMIEGLKAARHPFVVFSDADTRADRSLLVETSRAIASGADAAYATPYSLPERSFGGFVMSAAMNHGFAVAGALTFRLGGFRSFSGGWMGFRRSALEKAGGLERFETNIVDDYSIGEALRREGARIELLRRVIPLREQAGSVRETAEHLFKWLKIVRHAVPHYYALIPLTSPVFMAAAAAAVSPTPPFLALLAAVALLRSGLAWVQDRRLAGEAYPVPVYALLPLIDLFAVVPWLAAIFTRHVSWRGKTYRLEPGGRAVVVHPGSGLA